MSCREPLRRWSAEAVHAGPGIFGEPTGKRVQLWGITQHHVVGGKIVAEWMLFNELDLMMQLVAA
jgi:predicted ester cyclase